MSHYVYRNLPATEVSKLQLIIALYGATENARNENSAPSKMQVVKIGDMKMRHHTAWHENTGKEKVRHENTRHENGGNKNLGKV